MLKNYIKIAWRNILKNKIYSLINIAGLSIGIAASLLILQYVFFEKSYESFHENKDQLYRVTQDRYDKGSLTNSWAAGAFAVGNAFQEGIPEIEEHVKVYESGDVIAELNNAPIKIDQVYYAGESFFNLFSYPLIHGDPSSVLEEPMNLAISESTSQLLFGTTNTVGKILVLDGEDNYTISGVYQDFPSNTQLQARMIIPFKRFLQFAPEAETAWVWDGCLTYVKLQKDADPIEVEKKFAPIVEAGVGELLTRFNSSVTYHLQPLTDIHLYSDLLNEPRPNGNAKTVNLLLGVAFFILLIAWINYINLATARAIGRAREVGVRKAVGSERSQLITQFFVESGIFNLCSFVLAFAIILLVLPSFNQISGQDMSYKLFTTSRFWLGISGMFLISLFVSGLYPAIVLSGFKPVDVLKGKLVSTKKGAMLRRSLVVVQFAASLFLLIGSFIVARQIQFMRNQSLGMDIEQTLVIEAPIVTDSTFAARKSAFKSSLEQHAVIKSVSSVSIIPGESGGDNAGGIRLVTEDESQQKQYKFLRVDQDFISQYDLKIIAGRAFSKERDPEVGPVIFNRKGVQKLGFDHPEDAIGKRIEFWGDQYDIVGVVENFHQISLRQEVEPMILVMVPDARGYMTIKAHGSDIAQSIALAKTAFDNNFPGNTFEYFFLDESYEQQYRADKQFGKVFGIFTILAIIVACLGLFGLASFTTIQRRKEIGIRKVLGASVLTILKILFKEYAILLTISFLLAVPFSFLMIKNWLQGYAYRIDLHWAFFVIPFLSIVLVAISTVGFQAIKAAVANPIKSLRTE